MLRVAAPVSQSPEYGHHDRVRNETQQRRGDRAAGAEVERLADRNDARNEYPDADSELDGPAEHRNDGEDEQHARRLREAERAQQLTPARGAAEQLVADQI